MTMPVSGPISLFDARTELGLAGAISLQQAEVRNLFRVPAGAISLFDGYGKSAAKEMFIAIAHATTPFISIYPWSNAGFGTRFADPTTLPIGAGNDVTFSPNGDAIAIAHATSPRVSVYPWSKDGFGVKFENPSVIPLGGNGVAFSPDGTAIAVSGGSAVPAVRVYPWSSAGFGTVFTDPSTQTKAWGSKVTFSPNGQYIAFTLTQSTSGVYGPDVYQWTPSGFGTKYVCPYLGYSQDSGYGITFTPDSATLIFTSHIHLEAFAWSSAGFGTRYPNITIGSVNQITRGLAVSPNGRSVVVGWYSSPFIEGVPWTTEGFGTKFAPPTLAGIAYAVAFSPDGTAVAAAHATSPRISVFNWSDAGFGTKFTNPAVLPPGTGNGVAFCQL